MAFFGLTSLGAQNPFQTVQDTPLEAFDAADFTQAWTKVMTRDEGVVLETLEQLETIVRVIYHCPEGIATPADVWTIIRDHFLHSSLDDSFGALTFEQYLDRMTQARELSRDQDGQFYQKASEFSSSDDYRASLSKHQRMTKGPREKYTKPLTNSQQMGWTEPDVSSMPKRLPKQSCAETKFASAMVQAGAYY